MIALVTCNPVDRQIPVLLLMTAHNLTHNTGCIVVSQDTLMHTLIQERIGLKNNNAWSKLFHYNPRMRNRLPNFPKQAITKPILTKILTEISA